jgi:hypothetical protein
MRATKEEWEKTFSIFAKKTQERGRVMSMWPPSAGDILNPKMLTCEGSGFRQLKRSGSSRWYGSQVARQPCAHQMSTPPEEQMLISSGKPWV